MVAPKQIRDLAKLSRELGLKRIRVDGLEMEFGPPPPPARKPQKEDTTPEPEDDPLFDGVK